MNENVDIRKLNDLVASKSNFVNLINQGMEQTIVGQRHLTESLLIALLSNGHILLEGVPGLAKTLAIKTLSQLIDAKYSRIQFTPDLLPADVVGTMIYSVQREQFQVKKGPIFANFVLADEINRAPAKVQSALLEAMQERQVTIGDSTFRLDEPFLVMATQNPIEQVDEKIERYIVDIVFATRFPAEYGLNDLTNIISFGASPRASINLAKAARAYAFLRGRGYVVPEDVRAVCHDVMRHRLGLTYEAEANNITADEIISNILDKIEVP